MLNVKEFYGTYGLKLGALEHALINGYDVMASDFSVVIISQEPNHDPFEWLAYNFEGVVFVTKSGFLAMFLIFDDEEDDETMKAVMAINRLAGVVQ